MHLYDAWKRLAYDANGQPNKRAWDEYLPQEKDAYKLILRDKISSAEGTVAELGERFGLSTTHMAAFLDGIHECVDGLPDLDTLEETTTVTLRFDWERLYKQMVEYKAEELYTLPEWNGIFTPEQQKAFYTEQKKSHIIRRSEAKVGRNEPCPCGSGLKYKKCCGAASA
jgi:hypothetical protein